MMGTYGYCEETNKPISIARLKARPIATLSLKLKRCMKNLKKYIKKKNIKLFC